MKTSLKQRVIEHLEARELDDDRFAELQRLQSAHPQAGTGSPRRWLAVASVVVVVALGAMLTLLIPTDLTRDIADEVAIYHLKLRPLEVQGERLADLQPYFNELGFRLQPAAGRVIKTRLLGGRYCSIQGKTAAQLRLQDENGDIQTLYQATYDRKLFGDMPQLQSGESPRVIQVRGLSVELWVDKGLLFALTREP